MKKNKTFISGAVILMLSGLVVRMVGFVYRVYLSNLIGAEGMGLFQLVVPVYSLIIMTLTSGITVAVSRLTAQETAKKHHVNINRITLSGIILVVSASFLVSLLIFLKIDFVVTTLLKDPRTYSSIFFLIPCIPIIAASSVLKGHFYGRQNVNPPAWSQIVEQITKITFALLALGKYASRGLEYACAAATASLALGEIANMLILSVMYILSIKKNKMSGNKRGLMRKRRIIIEIFKIAAPISANRLITSLMSAIELIMIPARLMHGGMNYQNSVELYGKLTGMAMPIITFPALVTSSLATTLVPALSEALSLRSFRTINYRITKSIQLTFVLGFLFMAIFIGYPNEISDLIYRRDNVGEMIYILSFTCLFFYLQQTLNGILNGLGKESKILRNAIVGYVIRIAFVYFLLPVYGIKSYILAIIISSTVVCLLDLTLVIRTTGMPVDVRSWIIKPGIVCIVMCLSNKYLHSFFTIFIENKFLINISAIIGTLAAGCILMIVTGSVSIMDILKVTGLENSRFITKIGQKFGYFR
ncbi:MAG: stage V sporulation protein B [Clostridiaceae bacterium]|nr:stage V sporulation protein B [Clostridiaceae bacterium]